MNVLNWVSFPEKSMIPEVHFLSGEKAQTYIPGHPYKTYVNGYCHFAGGDTVS